MEERAEAAAKAVAIWEKADVADDEHEYLVRKSVIGHGIRQRGGRLVVPVLDAVSDAMMSLQFIEPNGGKRFLTGGQVQGGCFILGQPNGMLCIAEGYATSATIYESVGEAVAVAFDAGNIGPAARALRAKYPDIRIVICADDDYRTEGNPGLVRATEAARDVGGLVAVPGFGVDRPDGATDFNDLAQHRDREAVKRAIANATAPDVTEAQPATGNAPTAPPWPAPLDSAALHGIAGDFVRLIEPHTESDPAAILTQFLVCFGALVGRGPFYQVESTRHYCNLFALLVGESAKARKGTSWDRVRAPFEAVHGWKPHVSGLSSGEGLKFHLRDAREETKPNKHGELVTEVVDGGIEDKRLLVTEAEFASALRAVQRQGNTLSSTVREAWDSGNLRTLTKNDPITATGAHICIIGHIVADELRSELTATDTANGFANRFLFVAARRSKLLPFGGGDTDESELQTPVARLRERAELARTRGRITMTPPARAIWQAVYPTLSEGGDGLHGSVTARAEAQCVRLALVYALLDGAAEIDAPHLTAALAVWTYCDATALHIFGASLGDRTADEILRRLQKAGDAGLTRTGIRDIFGRNLSAERIGAALDLLQRRGRAACQAVATGGRPGELWKATK